MFSNPREIINTLESAIELFGSTTSQISREKARLMVVASRHALQALALELMERKFPQDIRKAMDVASTPVLKGHVDEKVGFRKRCPSPIKSRK